MANSLTGNGYSSSNASKVSTVITSPEYDKACHTWVLVEDAVAGQHAIIEKGTHYLPMPNPDDTTEANNLRYAQYLKRAVYYNTCFRTLAGMIGVAFRTKPKIEIPASIDYVNIDVDGGGLSIDQQAQWVLSEVIKKGRCGMMVDHPVTEGSISKRDVTNGIRATIKVYSPESVVDWNEETTNTGSRLNYVKLREYESTIDISTGTRDCVEKILTLRLQDGVYTVEHNYGLEGSIGEMYTPTDSAGKTLDFIPFIFSGSENNSPDIDQALLYDLAVINVAHYRNSADNEEASFICGQPTLAVTASLSTDDWNEQNPNGVQIGSRKGHFLGEAGSLSMVQAQPNNLPRELMKDKEDQMVSLGAQLVTPSSNETAMATGMKLATNTSALSLAVGNVSNAYEQCLEWVNVFMSPVKDDIKYQINTDFFPAQVGASEITAWVSAIQGQILPASMFYDQLRDANITAKSNDDIIGELEASSNGLDLSGASNV